VTSQGELIRVEAHDVKVTRPNEVTTKWLRPDGVTIRSVFDRLDEVEDSWEDFWRRGASLNRARQKLEKLNATRRVPQEAEV
jgi:hypothetical protein